MKCDYCGNEEDLPFICNYCGGTYCADHRLPESHSCIGDLSRRAAPVNRGSFWGSPYGSPRERHGVFSRIEIRDILVAWVALSLAFVIAERAFGGAIGFIAAIGISMGTVGIGFIFHELMHKFTAQHFGYWAEFRMWPMGIALALLTSLTGFIFAAPGATYINGYDIPKRRNGLISVAGPLTNIAIGVVFLLLLLVGNTLIVEEIGYIGFEINFFLATFNMLPIPPLDGSKVFRWNVVIWAAVFVPLAIVLYLLFTGNLF